MKTEFDLDKIYIHKFSKEELIDYIEKAYDKEFQVTFLPRTKTNADILIRSFKKELK